MGFEMDSWLVDGALALQAREGDREALAELVRRARAPLFALAYAELCHYDDAQDVVGAALLQICRHVGALREPEGVRAWMQAIVRNEIRMHRRRSRPERQALRLDELLAATAGGPLSDSVGSPHRGLILRLDVLQALQRLPWDEARAVALFYLSGLPIQEIAQHLGRPEGTIKRWLHLGRQRLAAELEEYAPTTPPC
jgi:RNA polymerase sigma-70 factor, ECF subfamily